MTHVMHIRTTICKRCGKAHSTSELYVVTKVGPGWRHMVRATEPISFQPEMVTLPIEHTETCHECVHLLPTNPVPSPDWHVPLGWRARERVRLLGGKLSTPRTTSDDLA